MAPAGTPRKRARENNFFEPGVQGRKTGITLKDTGLRDEHGLEVIDGVFSSPAKSPEKGRKGKNNSTLTEEEMEIGESTIPEPTEVLSVRRLNGNRNPVLPPPRARSPIKTSLNSPARRQSSLAAVSSPIRKEHSTPHRAQSHPAVNRKLDFSTDDITQSVEEEVEEPSPSPSKRSFPQILRKSVGGGSIASKTSDELSQLSSGRGKRRRTTAAQIIADDVEADDSLVNGVDDHIEALTNGDDFSPVPHGDDTEDIIHEDASSPRLDRVEQEEEEEVERETVPKRRPGRPRKSSPLQTKAQRKVQPQPAEAVPPPRKRGRPAKVPRLDLEDSASSSQDLHPPKAKKASRPPPGQRDPNARITSAKRADDPPSRIIEAAISRSSAGRPDKPRSLYILRRETPMEDDGAHVTRSGRTSVKPLAYWRNERIVYGEGEGRVGEKILLPSIKEIIRTEEVEHQPTKRARGRPKGAGRKRKAVEEEDEDEDEQEDWEREDGTLIGPVKNWNQALGGSLDDQVEEAELAYAASAIETREVANTTFRYAKTLTLPFFGSGMVDLPPAGVKKMKNSRKMQMVFFVYYGRVQVTVANTQFGIGKGGMWQVPRG
ncbi:MAG: hypothetical protein M1819_001557 [Sarea resinae]|nr:MAG: hypothetical protein M1819_001557 [Sarea resinae]